MDHYRFEYPQPPPQYTATAPVPQPPNYFIPHQPIAPVILQPNFILQPPRIPVVPYPTVISQQPRRSKSEAYKKIFWIRVNNCVFLPFLCSKAVVHVYQNTPLGPHPMMIACPSCDRNVLTKLKYQANTTTHLMALGFCIFG